MNSPSPTFCRSWFRARKRPIEIWARDRARQAHHEGSLYTVLIGPPEKPTHFIEVTSRAYGVGFLDEHLREYLSYSFQQVDDERLFLSMATYREFDGDTDQVVSGINYVFKTTGELAIQKETFHPQHSKETAGSRADVSGNYEMVPSFGTYDALLMRERDLVQA